MLVTALEMRWRRAQNIPARDVKRDPKKRSMSWVRSQSYPSGGYMVELHFTKGKRLKKAHCTCPDFSKEYHELATPVLHGVRVCKHVLAAAREATNA
jgi:hypothetical protein